MTRASIRAALALSAAGFLAVVGFLAPVSPVRAQQTGQPDVGLDQVGGVVRLSATDPRTIAVRIINIGLSLIAIVLVSIIVYAGYLWMTSGGDKEKVERAKRMIRNAIIGVVIIVSSWAVTRFILNSLTGATGGGGAGGSSQTGGPAAGGSFGFGAGLSGFRLDGIEPVGSVPLRNVQVRFLFTQDVGAQQASDHVHIVKAGDGSAVAGSLQVEGRLVTFTPSAACPSPASDRFCFDAETDFIARVDSSMKSASGQAISCGGLGAVCEARFRTGTGIDTAAPTVSLLQPYEGESVPQNASVELIGSATDDSGISMLQFSADGRVVGRATPTAGTTPTSFEGRVAWSTEGVSLGAHRLEVAGYDADSNHVASTPVSVVVRAETCFNDRQDGDETGIDCGGASCGACTGGTCREAGDCATGVCTSGRCVDRPIITAVTPNNGRVGTIVTVSGANFGTAGELTFGGGVHASVPARCSSSGTGWSNDEIVVEVPVGARTGAITVKNGTSGLSDTSDDESGPRVGAYTVNDAVHPGLCAIDPDQGAIGIPVQLRGAGFGSSSGRVRFGDSLIGAFRGWTDGEVSLNVPTIPSGDVSVRVQVGDELSNPVGFSVQAVRESEPPVIEAIEPASGPVGQYVTIRGRNFGSLAGMVRIVGGSGAEGDADVDFPDSCDLGTRYWSDTAVTIKVPASLRATGLGGALAVTPGSYQAYLQRRDGSVPSNRAALTVTAGSPGPGLCALLPDTGPVGTEVKFSGERFGSERGSVRFHAGSGVTEARSILEWSDQVVRAVVPSGAQTGAVSIIARGDASNPLPYTVRNCNEDATVCSETERCCEGSGVCVPQAGGVCPLVSSDAHYAWRVSTGELPIYPEVVNECDPASRRLASPSPWSGRPGGAQACVNADLVVRFTTRIDPAQVNGSSFVVRSCPDETGDCRDGTVVAPAVGFPRVEAADTDSSLIRFRPAANGERWSAATHYRAFLTTDIRSDRGVAMPAKADECGEGNAYCFRFSTRTSAEPCTVGSVLVNPSDYRFDDLEQETDVHANPLAAEDACLQLNPDAYGWAWSVHDQDDRVDARVAVSGRAGPTGQSPDQTATSRAETGAEDPAFVSAAVTVGRSTVAGAARMSVELTPFAVVEHGPECDQACVNAAVWASFSHPVQAGSIVPANVELRRCADAACRTMDDPFPLAASALRLMAIPGEDAAVSAGRFLRIDATSYLRAGQTYRVVLRSGPTGGLRSARGQALASLNDPRGYAWNFRVKTENDGRCTVDHVDMAPDEKIETVVGARQRFTAVPVSPPDACTDAGEYLISDRPFAWSVVDAEGRPDPTIARLILRTDAVSSEAEAASAVSDDVAPVRAGSSVTDQQLAEISATRDPGEGETRLLTNIQASYEGRNGRAVYGLLCGQRSESACPAGSGLTSGGCCAPRPVIESRYPEVSGTGVCRNTLVFADFSTSVDQGSLQQSFLLAKRVSGVTCPENTRPLDNVLAGRADHWYARAWRRVVTFFRPASATADMWCVGAVTGQVSVVPRGTGSRVLYQVESALDANTDYRMYVRGVTSFATVSATTTAVRSERGVWMAQETREWTFRTGPSVCQAHAISIDDTSADSPYMYTRHPETHLWTGTAQAEDPTGRVVPITPIREYDWAWGPWISSKPDVLSAAADAAAGDGDRANVTENGRNGQSFISGRFEITRDTVNEPSTSGTVVEASKNAVVDLCERPWPARTLGAFTDGEGSPSLRALASMFTSGPFYHFSTMYCMDAGTTSTRDDLPELRLSPVPLNAADTDQGILRQYLFTFQDPALRSDGIGIRIASNPLHLSAARWFASRGFAGEPAKIAVDGYDAVKNGNTVYISGSNVLGGGETVQSNIYILSMNPDAKAQTQEIFRQLLANFALNTNLSEQTGNVCVRHDERTGDHVFLRNGQPVTCSADWECGAVQQNLTCASMKAKLQRDRARISDFQAMNVSLEAAHTRTGKYPTLGTGSFIQGLSTSRWPSWGQTLATDAGGDLPSDPVNKFVSCGRCQAAAGGELGRICSESADCDAGQTCVAMTGSDAARNGFDPATCWNPTSQRYLCPALQDGATTYQRSHIYQYRAIDGGARYELATNFEALSADAYRPALITNLRRCSNTGSVCTASQDCIVRDPATSAVRSTGSCLVTGGTWTYGNICSNTEYASSASCAPGQPLTPGQLCHVGDTQSVACTMPDGSAGTKLQVCSDCREFVDGAQSVCLANVLCGNGRVDRGEACDDGPRNGQYGFCSRTCQEVQGACGDGLVGAGETCDNGAPVGTPTGGRMVNGQYCGEGCTLASSCGLDCRSRAPHCGDRVVDGPEQCDGNTLRSQGKLCIAPFGRTAVVGNPCESNSDCPSGFSCGATIGGWNAGACTGQTVQACSGGTSNGLACTSDAGCPGGRCVGLTYPTYHLRTCRAPGAAGQCTFNDWTPCTTVSACGDGVVDRAAGEECDNGESGNTGTGTCTPRCKLNVCGDGFVNRAVEECDFAGRNGVTPSTLEYGSVGSSCTTQCRLSAVTGGYCGNGVLDGGEVCDTAADGRPLVPLDATCRSLGFDYAEEQRESVDQLRCNSSCAITGCQLCSARLDPSRNQISAVVRDGILQRRPIPQARVLLRYNGTPVAETFTDDQGRFTFGGLHDNDACGNYTVSITIQGRKYNYTTGRLDRTADPTDGYYPYLSSQFSYRNFATAVGRTTHADTGENEQVILLSPRPGTGETIVIREWNSQVEGRPGFVGQFTDPQLVLPQRMGYAETSTGLISCVSPTTGVACRRTINWGTYKGSLNMSALPHAGLACSEADADNSCSSDQAIAETIFYRRTDPAPGVYRYFLVDTYLYDAATDGNIDTPGIDNKVRIAWRDTDGVEHYQEVVPSSTQGTVTADVRPGAPACKKYWHVFDQDAVTGRITIVNRFMCDDTSCFATAPSPFKRVTDDDGRAVSANTFLLNTNSPDPALTSYACGQGAASTR